MIEFYAALRSVSDVKLFVSCASLHPADIDVISGRYTVDAKSVLGICSLDLDKPVLVRAYGEPEAAENFRTMVSALIVPAPEP